MLRYRIFQTALLTSILFYSVLVSARENSNTTETYTHFWQDTTLKSSIRYQSFASYSDSLIFTSPKLIETASSTHLELALSEENYREASNALDNWALALINQGRSDKAIEKQKRAIYFANLQKDSILIAQKTGNLGSIYYHLGELNLSYKCFNQSLQIYSAQKKTLEEGKLLNNIGLLFYEARSYDFALMYFKKALNKYKEAGILEKQGHIWTQLAGIYYNQGNLEDAKKYIKRALKALPVNNLPERSNCYYLSGQIDLKEGNNASAITHFQKVIAINDRLNNLNLLTATNAALGSVYLRNYSLDLAEPFVKHLLYSLNRPETLSNETKVTVYKFLYELEKKKGNTPGALDFLEHLNKYEDSLQLERNATEIIKASLHEEYNNKIQSVKSQGQKKLQQSFSDRKQQILAILICTFLAVGGIMVYVSIRIRRMRKHKSILLTEIEELKTNLESSSGSLISFELNREKIESHIGRSLNETDWKVLNILLEDPVSSNKEISEKAFLSVDGIGSSLRRMYEYFEIKESKYKKISLLLEAVKHSK